MKQIKRYIPRRTPVSASDLNEIVAELVRVGKLSVAPPLAMRSDSSGVHIRLQAKPQIVLVEVGDDATDNILPVFRVRPGEWPPAVIPAERLIELDSHEVTKVANKDWDELVPDLEVEDRLFATWINGQYVALAPFEHDP